MIRFFCLIFLFLSASFNLNATNIRVVDLQFLLDQNKHTKKLIDDIDTDQKIHRDKYKQIELNLQSQLEKIDELKLILDNSELEKEVSNYNEDFKQFNSDINKFNLHYENQLNNLKNIILKNILEILKKYSLDNKIDLILDSKSYILSNNSINITDMILLELNEINLKTKFEKFK